MNNYFNTGVAPLAILIVTLFGRVGSDKSAFLYVVKVHLINYFLSPLPATPTSHKRVIHNDIIIIDKITHTKQLHTQALFIYSNL